MGALSAGGRVRCRRTATVGHPEGHRVDVDEGETVELLLVRAVLVVLLGGLPMKAFNDEDVLESVLGDHEEGVSEVERADGVPWRAGHDGYDGVVRNGVLPQGSPHQQRHVQRPRRVLVPVHVSLVEAVDDRASDADKGHQAQTNNVEDVVHGERLAILAGLRAGIYLHLINDKDSQAAHQNDEAQHNAHKEGSSEELELEVLDVVGVVVYKAPDVLPHDVNHGGGEQAVLDVEGIQPEVAVLEDLADLAVAIACFC